MFKKLFGLKPETPAVAAEDVYFQNDHTNLKQFSLKDNIQLHFHEWPIAYIEKAPRISKLFITEMRSLLSFHGLAGPQALQGQSLAKAAALYACCFQARHKLTEARRGLTDTVFQTHIDNVRQKAIEAIIADTAMYKERIAAAERERAAQLREPVLQDADMPLIERIKTLTPDDWHEIAQAYNWDYDLSPLWWIAAQPNCDAATATVILAQAQPGDYFDADSRIRDPEMKSNLHEIAKRLSGNFYQNNVLLLNEADANHWQGLVEELNDMGIPGVKIPARLFYRNGKRRHRPTVSIQDDELVPVT